MKKGLLLSVCALSFVCAGSAQAFEKPNLSTLKNVAATTAPESTAKAETSAQDAAFQKAFQASLDNANKMFDSANVMADAAIWTLGDVLLEKSVMDDFKSKKAEAGTNSELLTVLNALLKSKTFDSSDLTSENVKYVEAVTNLQIASNRYQNIINNMSPNFKKVLDGEVSLLGVKSQLVESGKLTKSIQSTSGEQRALLRKLKRINEQNSVYVTIPDNEAVKYNKDGIVGSINYSLDTINSNVDKSYQELITAFNLKNKVAEEKAKINNNPDLTKKEKDAALKKIEADILAEALKEQAEVDAQGNIKKLTSEQNTAIVNASAIMLDSLANYTALGLSCTKLGMQISSKPILAVPLALEVGQLKYTAQVIKDSASSLKRVSGQVVKIAKANNIKVNADASKGSSVKSVKF